MALDPSIILRDISPKFEPYENVLAKQMQIKAQQQQYDDNAFKLQQDRETSQQQNALAQFLSGNPDLKDPANAAKLYGFGVKNAQNYTKNQADIGKTKAETEKVTVELADRKFEMARNMLNTVQTPEQAQMWLKGAFTDPHVGPLIQQFSTYEDAVARIGNDPQSFAQWKAQASLTADKLQDKLHQDIVAAETGRHNKASEGIQIRGQDRQSADNAASRQVQMRGQNMVDSRSRESNAISGGYSSKPMPATALKMQNEALDVVGSASSTQANLTAMQKQIDSGKLSFGPISNAINQGRNMAGLSNEESRNFSSFKSNLEKLRNDSLRLNKGVQTDGDAQRAWNELFQNINDTKLVSQRLNEIKAINARAVDLRKREVEDVRNNYKQAPYDFGTQTNAPAAVGGNSGTKTPTSNGWGIQRIN
jgi:hypothetical protein